MSACPHASRHSAEMIDLENSFCTVVLLSHVCYVPIHERVKYNYGHFFHDHFKLLESKKKKKAV